MEFMELMELIKHGQMDTWNHVDYCMDYQRQKGTIKLASLCQRVNLRSKVGL